MSEEKMETPRILEELSKSNSAKTGKRNKKQQRLLIIAMVFFPLFLGLSYVGYAQWNSSSQLAILRDSNSQLTTSLTNLGNQSSLQNEQILKLESALAERSGGDQDVDQFSDQIRQLEESFADRVQSLNNMIAQLENRLGSRDKSENTLWQFSEAEFLIRLANRKVALESDVDSAIFLLQSADSLLRDSGDPAVYATREALSNELLALKSVADIDIEGIYARLAILVKNIDSLSLPSLLRENYENQINDSSQSERDITESSGFLNSAGELLSSIFVWRKVDESLNRVLTPQQEYYVKQNLHLMLEQIQLALLRGQQSLYLTTLQKTRDYLDQYISTGTGIGQQVVSEINALSQMVIVASMPDISQSLNLIKQFNSARNNSDQNGTSVPQ